jgi:ribosomal protein S12 methylthiotransferase
MVSLGCPKNLVDSEVMLGVLARHGYDFTPRAGDADVLIVNTCSFIEPAKQESIDTIVEMAEHKKSGSASKLIVAGCLVEQYRQDILNQIPEVDFVIGTNELERVLEACDSIDSRRSFDSPYDPYLYTEFTPRVLTTPSYSAYLKIAEGCDHPCSFCVIPQMRGRFRSRRFESVVREAGMLADRGVRELTLIGQDTTSYGRDLGLRNGLGTLLRELGRIPGLVWLRFLYCYPNQVTDELIAAVAETKIAAKYFDIPLQHGSADVLKGMRRGSGQEQFLRLLEKIRAAIPGVALRTSMIVGFPGETDEDFNTLMDFVKAAQFDHLGVFLYSNEEGSASFDLPDPVPPSLARRRQRKLMAMQRTISRRKLKGKIGRSYPIIVEGRAGQTDLLFEGRLESQAPEIDGRVLINDFVGPEPRAGEFRWATITGASDYDLIALLGAETFGDADRPASDGANRLNDEWRRSGDPVTISAAAQRRSLVNIQPCPTSAVAQGWSYSGLRSKQVGR